MRLHNHAYRPLRISDLVCNASCTSHTYIPTTNMDSQSDDAVKVAADAARDLTRLWRAWRTIHEMCQDRVPSFFFPSVVDRVVVVLVANAV